MLRRVNALLKRVEGVKVERVVVGEAIVRLPAGIEFQEVERAVEGGGFQIARCASDRRDDLRGLPELYRKDMEREVWREAR